MKTQANRMIENAKIQQEVVEYQKILEESKGDHVQATAKFLNMSVEDVVEGKHLQLNR